MSGTYGRDSSTSPRLISFFFFLWQPSFDVTTPTLMSSPTRTPQTAMSQLEIDGLIHVLRHANSRSSNRAAAFRTFFRPTHHARKHARDLYLSIDIRAAAELDPRQISSVTLPVLDSAPSPSTAEEKLATQLEEPVTRMHALKIVAPIPRHHCQIEGDDGVKEVMARSVRPKFLSAISGSGPRTISSASVYSVSSQVPQGLESRWSVTTIGDVEEDDQMQVDVPQDAEGKTHLSFDHNKSTDILASPSYDFEDEDAFASLRPRFAVIGSARARISLPPMRLNKPARRPPLPTRIPRRHDRRPQRPDMPVLNSSGSDTSQSSSLTPVSPEWQPSASLHQD